MFDYVIAGCGLAGSVLAERIANELGKRVLVIEKRGHIGGNVYDYYDEAGILVHKYGPHIFHTNAERVWNYLSAFTAWTYYQHEVKGFVDGGLVPIPFNLNSLYQVFSPVRAKRLEEKLTAVFGQAERITIADMRGVDDADVRQLYSYIYDKVFLHYTVKQWGCAPEELDAAVTGRVPVLITRDDRYFRDKYQAMPSGGYTRMIGSMLDNPLIKVLLNTDCREVLDLDGGTGRVRLFGRKYDGTVIYTGMVDELLGYSFGELPYRSVRFEFETFDREYYQTAATVNYPGNYDFTRITEFKQLTGQQAGKTTVVREYPGAFSPERESGEPAYPVLNPDTRLVYERYAKKAAEMGNVVLVGRLAEYAYYDMDKIVLRALEVFDGLRGERSGQ